MATKTAKMLNESITTAEYCERLRASKKRTEPLWPAPYDEDNAECALRFVYDCVETFEETSGQPLRIPHKDYIDWVVNEWHAAKLAGQPLVFEKSRRLVMSWLCGALELHTLGCRTGVCQISANGYEGPNGSRQFVYRTFYLYQGVQRLKPEWRLATADARGSIAEKELDSLRLANGSMFFAVNAQGSSFRGSGTTIARAEELSQYQYVDTVWGQMLTVTAGPPGSVGGFAYAINNASPNEQWKRIKQR